VGNDGNAHAPGQAHANAPRVTRRLPSSVSQSGGAVALLSCINYALSSRSRSAALLGSRGCNRFSPVFVFKRCPRRLFLGSRALFFFCVSPRKKTGHTGGSRQQSAATPPCPQIMRFIFRTSEGFYFFDVLFVRAFMDGAA
jgi:hypothetical protein